MLSGNSWVEALLNSLTYNSFMLRSSRRLSSPTNRTCLATLSNAPRLYLCAVSRCDPRERGRRPPRRLSAYRARKRSLGRGCRPTRRSCTWVRGRALPASPRRRRGGTAPPESRHARVPSLPRSPRVSRESSLRRNRLAVRALPREQILHQMLRDLWGGKPDTCLAKVQHQLHEVYRHTPDPWTWPSCAAFAANRWCCVYLARKRTRIASTSNALKGPAASFSGETNHPAVKSNAGSSKASTPNGAPSDAVLPLPCTLSVPGARLPSRANGNPKAPPNSASDGPWLANVDCTESTNRERAVGARTRHFQSSKP